MTGFNCLDCDIDTGDINEYYMVHDKLWRRINPQIDGMLCVTCTETRLGRVLNHEDFTDAPINGSKAWTQSALLLDRLRNVSMPKLSND